MKGLAGVSHDRFAVGETEGFDRCAIRSHRVRVNRIGWTGAFDWGKSISEGIVLRSLPHPHPQGRNAQVSTAECMSPLSAAFNNACDNRDQLFGMQGLDQNRKVVPQVTSLLRDVVCGSHPGNQLNISIRMALPDADR
jgi:hypothetical protein